MDIFKNRNSLDLSEVWDLVGIKFRLNHCLGERQCKRDLIYSGGHEQHVWYDEILRIDEVFFHSKNLYGKEKLNKIEIPIRFNNFLWAYMQTRKNNPSLTELSSIKKAMILVKEECFDLAGNPEKMSERLGFSSYKKFNEFVVSELKSLI